MEKDLQYRQDIIEAIEKIRHSVGGLSYQKFVEDIDIFDACVRRLEIIGEAAKCVSDEFREHYSNVPWKEIAGFRDKAIHDYASLNSKIVWETIKNDLTILYDALVSH